MSNTNPTLGPSWTTVVSRGLKTKVPTPLRRITTEGKRDSYSTSVLYEDPEIAAYTRSQQVNSILQTSLAPKAVVFDFPASIFSHHTDAYKIIEEQLGPVHCNGFNPISRRDPRQSGNLIISTEFEDTMTIAKAISSGVVVDDIQYRATAYKDTGSDDTSLTRVNISVYRLEGGDDVLLAGLLASLLYYGKVHQIKKVLCRNYFEGEISVLLDRTVTGKEDSSTYQTLTRMLYLEAWDTFVPASFKGAQPVCYYCRQAGHVKNSCPSLKQLKCFKCGDNGHTKRRCRQTGGARTTTVEEDEVEVNSTINSTFEEDLLAYENLQKPLPSQEIEKVSENIDEETTDDKVETMDSEVYETDSPVSSVELVQSDASIEEDVVMNENKIYDENARDRNEEPDAGFQRTLLNGSLASKHASASIRSSMDTEDDEQPKRVLRSRSGDTQKNPDNKEDNDTTIDKTNDENNINLNARSGHD